MAYIILLIFIIYGVLWVIDILRKNFHDKKNKKFHNSYNDLYNHKSGVETRYRNINTLSIDAAHEGTIQEENINNPPIPNELIQQDNYFLLKSKQNQLIPSKEIQGSLLVAQSHGRRLSENTGTQFEIYKFIDDEWVWVDKIYPSESAILKHMNDDLSVKIQKRSRTTGTNSLKFEPRLCKICGCVLEGLVYEGKVVLFVCPNGHDPVD